MKTFADYGIQINPNGPEQQRTLCPKCSHTRTKRHDPCLSVNVREGVWNCKNGCGFAGTLRQRDERREWRTVTTQSVPAGESIYRFFENRSIPRAVVDRNRITQETRYVSALEGNCQCIAFNYYVGEQLVNVKYRTSNKSFQQVKGGEKSFYKINDLAGQKEAIITEGEMDALAFEVAGFLNAVSVPEGGINETDKKTSGKLKCLDNCEHYFTEIEKVYLATDDDPPGLRLREELARRLGKERCFIVEFPSGCKDANETLKLHGPDTLRRAIEEARPYPIEGIFGVEDVWREIDDIYDNDFPEGATTGFTEFDSHFKLFPGQLTIVTGVATHGKTNFLDQMLVKYITRESITAALFTPENYPMEIHYMRIIEQLEGKPFRKVFNGRMSREELQRAKEYLKGKFFHIKPANERFTPESILSHAAQLVQRYGIEVLVIDPWNTIEHNRPANLSETEHTALVLNQFKFFARNHGVHLFLVAHPKKMPLIRGTRFHEIPTPYDISGSAHFYNVPDNVLCVYRQFNDDETDSYTIVLVQKIKHQHIGRMGRCHFDFEVRSKRFYPQGTKPFTEKSELEGEMLPSSG